MSDRLAVNGGTPVRDTVLPYGRHWIDESDVRAVTDVLRSEWLTTGPAVSAFEAALAKAVGSEQVVVVASGTAALHCAAAAIGLGPGDEVIVPPLTFVASANCVVYVGATPVFADIRSDTLNLDPGAAAAAITDNTRAIVAVDYGGQPADLDELRALAAEHDLVLIEDASHALGATYHGRPVGSLSDLTAFSFHPVKHATTGEGGAIATDRAEWADSARRFRNHGFSTDHRQRGEHGLVYSEMVQLGFNYRLPDLGCALGMSQLARHGAWLERRREIATLYQSRLGDIPALRAPTVLADREPAWHLYPVLLQTERLSTTRADLLRALRAEGIGVNVHYVPVYWHPYYQSRGYGRGLCPVAEDAYDRLLSLPIFPAMTNGDVDDVVAALHKVTAAYAA